MADRVWISFQGPLFVLKAPSDWFFGATPTVQALMLEPDQGQRLRANLMVTLRPVQSDVTLDGVVEQARDTQSKSYPGYHLERENEIEVSSVPGKYQLYQWINPDDDTPVLQAQAFFLARNVLITLTATCDLEAQRDIVPIFNAMFESFELQLPPQN